MGRSSSLLKRSGASIYLHPVDYRMMDEHIMEGSAALRRSVISGVRWAAATRLFGQMVNWIMTLAVVRYLHPVRHGFSLIRARKFRQ